MSSPYSDLREDFFRSYFSKALPYDAYLQTGEKAQASRWHDYADKISLSPELAGRVRAFIRKMPILVMSGIWCGDCARQGPMLRLIEQANPLLEFRYIDNRQNPELQNELRINGAEKVPVVVSFSEDFYELSRFGDRHLSVYRRKLETETGAACDPGFGSPEAELEAELEEWVNHFERLQAILRLAPMLRRRYSD